MTAIAHALAKHKGFYDGMAIAGSLSEDEEDAFIERTCNNLHDEVSELHTAWREGELRLVCDKAAKMRAAGIEPLTSLEEELADIVIRAFDTAEYLCVDLGRAIAAKHAFNETRPRRHGGKKS